VREAPFPACRRFQVASGVVVRREQDVLERAVHAVTAQATKADDLVDQALAAGWAAARPS